MRTEETQRHQRRSCGVRRGSARRGRLTGGRTVTSGGIREIPRWRLFILHGGARKFFGLMISFFRSFISFLRSFISPLGGEFSFPRELSRIFFVGSVIRSQEFVFLIGRGTYIYNSSLKGIPSPDSSMCSCHRIVLRKLSTTWRISSGR